MTSLARTLAILNLFTPDQMVWTAEGMAQCLGYTRPTGYRYIRELVANGFLVRFGDGTYSLGPRIVELDFLIRQADPLLAAGLPIIQELVSKTGYDMNLAGLYGDRIITIHQEHGDERLPLSFGRGRPLPLLRGAASKIIVAHLPRSRLKRIYDTHRADAATGSGTETWAEFQVKMGHLRKLGYATSQGELDQGFAGVAVPIFGPDGRILGCIVAALTQQRFSLVQVDRLVDLLKSGAERVGYGLAALDERPSNETAMPQIMWRRA
jgi:DNA-binding IclR family transcriptional regulator